ncbi:RimJ/RimL family protein N-acetyltransferase [Algoriphagus sp. 4150]|uniref:GNAT family N-acetyltransferase n=1 Tax=Algoriphagus sp. 4150 TaxID=2817756 RepID=UPI002863E3D3|nr:GNAT family protein [Algoriphagus sp. 4150]MDR7131900.1 RimJ/RimL family protein N-acetyltransferase [Algoriphagus sp. 4150]
MMLDSKLILENDRVLLRPITEDDFSGLMSLTNDPALWTYFTYDLSSPEEFREWAKPALEGQRFQFLVWDKSINRAVGSTAFGNYSPRDERIEIGWTWLGRQFHGTGINQAMKLLMLEYCFETLKLKRVEIKTDVLNMPARKALLKFGAVEEGVLRSHTLLIKGRRRDTIYYSVLDSEWERIKR